MLLSESARALLYEHQTDRFGVGLPMTLGWHISTRSGPRYLFKRGGGGGFRSEMRIYPESRVGSVVKANSTTFKTSAFVDRMDRVTALT